MAWRFTFRGCCLLVVTPLILRWDDPMSKKLFSIFAILFLLVGSVAHGSSTDVDTAIGTVEKFDKESVIITLTEKPKKSLELKITGTSNFALFAPQVRSGKTVMTQRKVEGTDLAKGQFIAVIYAHADKENILLNAVLKPVDTPSEKPAEKK